MQMSYGTLFMDVAMQWEFYTVCKKNIGRENKYWTVRFQVLMSTVVESWG